jgi:hypothetical protein
VLNRNAPDVCFTGPDGYHRSDREVVGPRGPAVRTAPAIRRVQPPRFFRVDIEAEGLGEATTRFISKKFFA